MRFRSFGMSLAINSSCVVSPPSLAAASTLRREAPCAKSFWKFFTDPFAASVAAASGPTNPTTSAPITIACAANPPMSAATTIAELAD